jgi:hypothetical protein
MLLLPSDLLFPSNIVIHHRLVVLGMAIIHLGLILFLQLKIPNAVRVIQNDGIICNKEILHVQISLKQLMSNLPIFGHWP